LGFVLLFVSHAWVGFGFCVYCTGRGSWKLKSRPVGGLIRRPVGPLTA
jgi:hypothetical protein